LILDPCTQGYRLRRCGTAALNPCQPCRRDPTQWRNPPFYTHSWFDINGIDAPARVCQHINHPCSSCALRMCNAGACIVVSSDRYRKRRYMRLAHLVTPIMENLISCSCVSNGEHASRYLRQFEFIVYAELFPSKSVDGLRVQI
jgi:hypothetical protein